MTLGLLALRAITVKALIGQTLAGNAVHPSALLPISDQAQATPKPFIQVFTDSVEPYGEAPVTGRDMLAAEVVATLAFEVAVATNVPAEDGNGTELTIPPTDEGFEITLDLIHRAIVTTLQCGGSNWAELWRRLVLTVRRVAAIRGAGAEKGIRFAARRIELALELVDDPVPGEALPGLWIDILAAFEADQDLAALVPVLQAAAAGTALPSWAAAQATLGLTYHELAGIGLAPFLNHQESPTAAAGVLQELDIDAEAPDQ